MDFPQQIFIVSINLAVINLVSIREKKIKKDTKKEDIVGKKARFYNRENIKYVSRRFTAAYYNLTTFNLRDFCKRWMDVKILKAI